MTGWYTSPTTYMEESGGKWSWEKLLRTAGGCWGGRGRGAATEPLAESCQMKKGLSRPGSSMACRFQRASGGGGSISRQPTSIILAVEDTNSDTLPAAWPGLKTNFSPE